MLLVSVYGVLGADAAASALSPAQTRGKQIYVDGISAAGRPITAHVGRDGVPVPASALPCANCHGRDGLGRPEGGVIPSNITWSELTKTYGNVSATGRRRSAYTLESLAGAITAGIDPAGNRLSVTMPRYQMDSADMADLLAYLQRIEHDLDPGLSGTTIHVGTVLPQGGPTASLGEAIAGVLKAYFADINAQGGIYGRRLELEVTAAPTRDLVLRQLSTLIERGETFALVAPVTVGLESQLDDLAEQKQLPVIGPFTQFPADTGSLERFTFYLFGGLTVQASALLGYAEQKLGLHSPRVAVVYPQGGQEERTARAIHGYTETHKWPPALLVDYRPGLMNAAAIVSQLRADGVQALVFLGPGRELGRLAYESARSDWLPYLLLAGFLAGRTSLELPTAFDGRIFVAYPTLPVDHTPVGKQEFGGFHQRHGLPGQHLPAQISAYAAAKLFVQGLKAAGRDLSRDKLIGALEALHGFNTGVTPPLTYSANRRIGALGAHIVTVDLPKKRFHPNSTWVEVE